MSKINKRLTSGCKPLDDILCGGFEIGVITQIFGEAGSGKTNICLQTAIKCAKDNGKVIFIDTEGISNDRFIQIAGENSKDIAQNIIIYEPYSFEEQHAAIKKLDKITKENIDLIIMDSATMFYRLDLGDDELSMKTRRELTNQLGFLHILARKYSIAVIITSQVYTDINTGKVKSIGGTGLDHISKTILHFEKTGIGIRRVKIHKHRSCPEGTMCKFTITNNGIQ